MPGSTTSTSAIGMSRNDLSRSTGRSTPPPSPPEMLGERSLTRIGTVPEKEVISVST